MSVSPKPFSLDLCHCQAQFTKYCAMNPWASKAEVAQHENITILNLAAMRQCLQLEAVTAMKRIEKRTFPSSEAFDFESELLKKNTFAFVACQNATEPLDVVAYLIYCRTKRLTLLHKICVVEHFRKRGIAKALLSALRTKVRLEGSNSIDLWVDEDRPPARALYTSCGFEEVDRLENYYGMGRTGLKMSLDP